MPYTEKSVPSNYGTEIGTQTTPGDDLVNSDAVEQHATHPQRQSNSANAFNSDRPLNVQPAPEGGVAIDGRKDLPEGKPGLMDKALGKIQKVTGKYTNNPEMHERGELRESGGKAAAQGEARAPHD